MNVNFIVPIKASGTVWFAELGQARLGLCPNSGWQISLRGKIKNILEPKDMIMLLPLLELGRQKVYDQLTEIAKNRKDVNAVEIFPETMLLKCAFEYSVSDYWPMAGLKWLESSPQQLSNSLKDTLAELRKCSWAKQLLKQKIKLILKRQ